MIIELIISLIILACLYFLLRPVEDISVHTPTASLCELQAYISENLPDIDSQIDCRAQIHDAILQVKELTGYPGDILPNNIIIEDCYKILQYLRTK